MVLALLAGLLTVPGTFAETEPDGSPTDDTAVDAPPAQDRERPPFEVASSPEPVKPEPLEAEEPPVKGFDAHYSQRIESKTTVTSETYLNADGTMTQVAAPWPVRFKDNEGAWQEVDTTVVDDGTGDLRSRSTLISSRLQLDGRTPVVQLPTPVGVVTMREDAHQVRRREQSQRRNARRDSASHDADVEGRRARFDAAEERTLEYRFSNTGIKEDIILQSARAGSSYDVTFDLPAALRARETKDGIDFVTADGKVMAQYGGGLAGDRRAVESDRDVAPPGTTTPVEVELVRTQGRRAVARISISRRWVTDRDRVFPVTIDPVIQVPYLTGNDDTYVNDDCPSCTAPAGGAQMGQAYRTHQFLRIGNRLQYFGTGSGNAQTFLPFPNLVLPGPGYTYQAAVLQLRTVDGSYSGTTPACAGSAGIFAIEQPWNPAGVTWNTRPPVNSLPDGFQPLSAAKGTDQFFLVTEAVRPKFTTGVWYGLGIGVTILAPGGGCGWRDFASSDAGLATAPLLYVQYDEPPPPAPPTPPPATGASYGVIPTQPTLADPVNVVTGNMVDTYVDHASPEQVFGLELARTYNLFDTTSSAGLGRGWSSSFSPTIGAVTGGVEMVAPDGRRVRWAGSGPWTRPTEFPADLTLVSGEYSVTFNDGTKWQFDTLGRLWKLHDPNDTRIVTVGRDGSGRISTIQSPQGMSLTVGWGTSGNGNGRITSVVGPNGTVSYGYDANGNLTSVTDVAGGITTYRYDSSNRLDRITDPAGVHIATNTFDSAGRVATQTAAGGVMTTFTYGTYVTGSSPQIWYSTVSDTATGSPGMVTYYYDAQLRVIQVKDNLPKPGGGTGNPSAREYGTSLNDLTRSIARNGVEARYTYDGANRVTCEARHGAVCPTTAVLSSGSGAYTAYAYDGAGRVTSSFAVGEGLTTYTYTGAGRSPTKVTDPAGKETNYTYNPKGLVLTETDADNVVRSYEYGANDRLVKQTDGAGKETTFAYDSAGRLRCTAYHGATCGDVQWVGGSGRWTATTYDTDGNVAAVRATDGGITSFTYDDAGRVVTTTDPTGAVTTNHYNPTTGFLTSVDKPGVWVNSVPTVRTWTYAYDSSGNRYCEAKPGGACPNAAGVGGSGAFTFTKYGPLGRVEYTKDELGHTTTYEYDPAGNGTKVTAPDGGIRRTVYDAAGRVTQTIDTNNLVTYTTYDSASRVSCVAPPGGSCSPASGTIATTTYDALGRVSSETSVDGGVTSYTYSAGGRRKTETSPYGGTVTTTFDAAGRPWKSTNAIGAVTTTTYDEFGEVATVTSPTGLVTSSTYDLAGRPATETDPAGVVTTHSYSQRGELLSERKGAQGTVRYGYNPDGSIEWVADPLTPAAGGPKVVGPVRRQGWDVVPDGTVPWSLGAGPGTAPAGAGSMQFGPIDGSVAANKFVAKAPIAGQQVSDLTSVDWKIYVDPTSAKGSEHLYANLYVDLSGNGLGTFQRGFYDCRYDLTTPTNLTKGVWHSRTYTPSTAVPYTTSVAAPCPATLSAAAGGSTVLAFVLNGGQSTASDAGLIGAFDAVTFATTSGNDVYDFEPEDSNLPRVTSYSYDGRGNRVGRTNALGKSEAWTYDDADELLTSADQLNRQTVHQYWNDPTNGRKEAVSDPTGRTTTTALNVDGTLKTKVHTGGPGTIAYSVSWEQQNVTRIGKVLDPLNSTGQAWDYYYGYDGQGRVTISPQYRAMPQMIAGFGYGYGKAGAPADFPTGGYRYDVLGRNTVVKRSEGSTDFKFVFAGGANGKLAFLNGDQWQLLGDVGFGSSAIRALASSDTTAVIAGDGGKLGTSGWASFTYTMRTSSFGSDAILGLAWSPLAGTFVAAGQNGKVATSPDGITWTQRTAGIGSGSIRSVVWADQLGLFVVASATDPTSGAPRVATSPDGITWTEQAIGWPAGSTVETLSWSGELQLLLAGGSGGRLATSPDGVTWTMLPAVGTNDLRASTWSPMGTKWVVAGNGGTLRTSSDLSTWSSPATGLGAGASVTTAAAGSVGTATPNLLVAGGAQGVLLTSPDGVTWTPDAVFGTSDVYVVGGIALKNQNQSMGPTATIAYDREDRVVHETTDDGSRSYSYGAPGSGAGAGRLVGYSTNVYGTNVSTSLTYDSTGRLSSETTNGVTVVYGYDLAGQLVRATPSTGPEQRWTFDELGRRATESKGSVTTQYRWDDANQLCWTATAPATAACNAPPVDAKVFTYDAAGRRTSEGRSPSDQTTYTYDAAGRLSVLAQTVAGVTATQTRYYTVDDILFEYQFGASNREPLPVSLGGATPVTGWTLRDLAGRPMEGGPIEWDGTSMKYQAGAWGPAPMDPWGAKDAVNGLWQSTGLRGEVTFGPLTHLWARDYDAATGSFTSKDPLDGIAGTTTAGQGYSYSYADNDPLNRSDPSGMLSEGAFDVEPNERSGDYGAAWVDEPDSRPRRNSSKFWVSSKMFPIFKYLEGSAERKVDGKTRLFWYDDDYGNCTRGYGHKVAGRTCTADELKRSATPEQAEAELSADMEGIAGQFVRAYISAPVDQCEFDALALYCFNRGAGNFKASEPRRLLNLGKYAKVVERFKAEGDAASLGGVRKYRYTSARIFGKCDYQFVP